LGSWVRISARWYKPISPDRLVEMIAASFERASPARLTV
jgi:hypothetical protein